ncbi:MAG TPA: hypothetical protein VGJ84_12940 [Polyangiaceae bacterium]|jgi:hypothetical protein
MSTTTSAVGSGPVSGPDTYSGGKTRETSRQVQSLLPAPHLGLELDAFSMLFALTSKARMDDQSSSERLIRKAEGERSKQWDQLRSALRKALEASRHKSFWHDLGGIASKVGRVALVVASIAVAVASCGAAAPIAALAIAGAVMSAAAMAQSELHVLQALGMSDKDAFWFEMGLAVGGSLATGGAGVGASASGCLKTVGCIADGAAGASTVAAGAAKVEESVYQKKESYSNTDAVRTRADISKSNRLLMQILASLEECERSEARVTKHFSGVIEAKGQAMVLAARA